jgi:hypothetical protein
MRWRDLLPWRSFVFETSWSPSTAVVEIKKRVGPRRWWPQRSDSPFVGASTGEYTFKFRRKISYRNPSLPVVCVVVQPAAHGGARVEVKMRLHFAVVPFLSVWMTGACLLGLGGLFAAVFRGKPEALVALLMPLFGAGFISFPFELEAREAEKLIREIFVAAPAQREIGPYRS